MGDLPIGEPVEGWSTRPRPGREPMRGEWCTVEPLDPERHLAELHESNTKDREGVIWRYMPYGPFDTLESYAEWVRSYCLGDDPYFHAVIARDSGRAVGVASYLNIVPEMGTIEIGHICYSPDLQRTTAATEALYLMMRRTFELGYRRCEWKCDAHNARSRRAAERLGFVFEGVFRQAVVVKGRNRDSAWFSVIDKEWPQVQAAHDQWRDPGNFEGGEQRRSLGDLIREHRERSQPKADPA